MRSCVFQIMVVTIIGAVSARAQEPAAVSPYSHNHVAELAPESRLALMRNGRLSVEIILAKNSPLVVAFAARELQSILFRATGDKAPILQQRTGTMPAIFLGDTPLARLYVGDPTRLPRDAFFIRCVADLIIIAGRDSMHADPAKALSTGVWGQLYERATLFGVYDFLERFAGVRFYFPGDVGTVIPKLKTLDIPRGTIREQPDFLVRNVSAYSGAWIRPWKNRKESFAFYNLNRYRARGRTNYIPNCHSLSREGLIERFAKAHPEYFALLPNGRRDNDSALPGHRGHLCFTNPGLADEIYLDAEAFLTGKPAAFRNVIHARWGYKASWDQSAFQPGYFNIMPQDGWGRRVWCRCQACQEYYQNHEQGASELYWTFVSKIARRLLENNIPGHVTAMAYGAAKIIPRVRIPGNVLVQVAVRGPWMQKEPELQKRDFELIRNWNKKLGNQRVWLWNYMSDYGGAIPAGIVPLSTRYLDSYYKQIGPDIRGSYLQTGISDFLFQYLDVYVYSRLAWNLQTDVKALVAEHHRKLFGPAAKPMSTFFARLEEIWIERCLNGFYDTPMGPMIRKRTEQEVWEEVYTPKILGEFGELFDQAQALAKDDRDAAMRVAFFREHLLGKILEYRNAYLARKREIEDLVLEATRVKAPPAVVVDGRLDEPAWKAAGSVFLVPLKKGEDPVVKTNVRVCWSSTHLYVAYDCEEPRTGDMVLAERKVDDPEIWKDASAEIFLNPSGDRKTYFQIIVNARGVFSDQKIITAKDSTRTYDRGWNSGIRVRTSIKPDRWLLELAIPVKNLQSGNVAEGESWVVNFCRNRNVAGVSRKENQLLTWSPFLTRGFHQLDRFGRIRFAVAGPEQHTVIIRNGSFEAVKAGTHPVNWSFYRDEQREGLVVADSSTYRHGQRSLRISASDKPDAGEKWMTTQMLPDIKPGTRYLLTFWLRLENVRALDEGHSGVFVNVNAGGNRWFPPHGAHGTMPWTKQGFEFTTPAKLSKPYIRLRLDNATGTAWFDEIRIRETGSTAKLHTRTK